MLPLHVSGFLNFGVSLCLSVSIRFHLCEKGGDAVFQGCGGDFSDERADVALSREGFVSG